MSAELKQGNFVAVTTEEAQLANFHTAIYEDDYKGLLIALCNQNGAHPYQAQLLLNGLDGKRQAADHIAALEAKAAEYEAAILRMYFRIHNSQGDLQTALEWSRI